MKKYCFFVISVMLMTIALTSCSEEDNSASRKFYLSAKQKSIIEQNNQFAFNFYKKFSNQADVIGKSNVLSPMSVTYMLGMLNAGMQGEGCEEILNALGMDGCSTDDLNNLCQTLLHQSPLVDKNVTLWQANCLVANKGVTLKDEYVYDMNVYYGAEVSSMDFSDQSTLLYINNWCMEHTNGLIPKIIEKIDPLASAMLLNAIYFDAPWANNFDENNTKNLRFNKEDGSSKILPLMCQTNSFAYGVNDTYATVCLPYGESKMWNMYVLLPNEGKTVKNVLTRLTPKSWKENVTQMSDDYSVNLRLPRFETSSDFCLNNVLSALGIKTMFDSEKGNFSRMTDATGASVSSINQKAVIKVNEKGTEAAAVTYTDWDEEGEDDFGEVKTVNFFANHPFVYLIQEASSDAVFFIGTYQGE